MREIADTTFGRNALLVGLISHVAAILVTMMSVSGGELFFRIVFPFSCLVFVIGAYATKLARIMGFDLKTEF